MKLFKSFQSGIYIFLLLASSLLYSQNNESYSDSSSYFHTFGKPLFLFNTYSFNSTVANKSQLNVFIAFVNDILQFVKNEDNSYYAKYEILIDIFDRDGNRLDGKILTKEVITQSFEETNSRINIIKHHIAFDLNPGSYDIFLELTDLDTKRNLNREKIVDIENFDIERIVMSDLMFVNSADIDSLPALKMFPNITKTLEDSLSELSAYFELYASGLDSIKLKLGVYTDENEPVYENSSTFLPGQKLIKKMVPLSKLINTAGYYVLVVEAKTANEMVLKNEGFIVQYSNTSHVKQTLDYSIAFLKAMKYITESKDYSDIIKTAPEEGLILKEQFWMQRDPTPGTLLNELKVEFYRRVEFCLQHFASTSENRAGWETDRGKIYIIYGSPSEVQRRSGDIKTHPTEIWYYNHIDRRFVFMDKSGSGSYRLIHKD